MNISVSCGDESISYIFCKKCVGCVWKQVGWVAWIYCIDEVWYLRIKEEQKDNTYLIDKNHKLWTGFVCIKCENIIQRNNYEVVRAQHIKSLEDIGIYLYKKK